MHPRDPIANPHICTAECSIEQQQAAHAARSRVPMMRHNSSKRRAARKTERKNRAHGQALARR